jgi:hypothetical protein
VFLCRYFHFLDVFYFHSGGLPFLIVSWWVPVPG